MLLPRPRHGARLDELMAQFPVVALVGPRQVGKTTLARARVAGEDAVYLDLELPSHRARLDHPELYLGGLSDRLVVLDEVQLAPDLFSVLRALVDQDRRPGRFLLLGSASPDLLQRSSESLAGRIAFHELTPFDHSEVAESVPWRRHWWRGGFPDAVLADDDRAARRWLDAFGRTYIERDLPRLGIGTSPEVLRRFLAMVAHRHGQTWNGQQLASSLGVSSPTVARYRDQLTSAFLLRTLRPVHRNLGKRLVKSPKLYVRDSGLLHATLRVPDFDALQGHPLLGASFEGYVVEEVARALPEGLELGFWRTQAGAEIDLVIHAGLETLAVIEVKYAAAPRPSRGFYVARADLGAPPGYVVHPGEARWPVGDGVEAVGVREMLTEVVPGM